MTNLKYALINNVNYLLLLMMIAFGRQSFSMRNPDYWFEIGTLVALMIGYRCLLAQVIYHQYAMYNPRHWRWSQISWGVVIIGTVIVLGLLVDFHRHFNLICGAVFIICFLRDYFSVPNIVEV